MDENGCSWRSGAKVERKLLEQWFIKTTRFAKSLQDGLDDPVLQDWRDIIKIQKHWIGNCNGVSFDFSLSDNSVNNDYITLWTNTPEYIENAEFVAVSKSNSLSSLDGTVLADGTKKLNIQAQNPITSKMLPIFLTNEIEFLDSTDTHLGISNSSEQDKCFCDKFNLPYTNTNLMSFDEIQQKQKEICGLAQDKKVGGYWTSAKLRDWLISRQRYWGTPIPIVYCKNCGTVPVPQRDLPIQLPKLHITGEKHNSLLSELTSWKNTKCPKCNNNNAIRETDTMDTFVDSSWYYLRYIDPNNKQEMFSTEKAKTITPVDLYIGGKEHGIK